jgi:hypothetical protein
VRPPGVLDHALILVLPGAALAMMAVTAERLWVVAAFTWWFGLSALPGVSIMTGQTRGRRATLFFLTGLVALALSCAGNLALLDRCAKACRFE